LRGEGGGESKMLYVFFEGEGKPFFQRRVGKGLKNYIVGKEKKKKERGEEKEKNFSPPLQSDENEKEDVEGKKNGR